jgi:PST family polysaccharide transporter
MATQLLGYLSRNVDSILVGRLFGPAALGLYDRAFQILMLPLNQISAPSTTVALPVLSRLQDDRARYDAFLLRGQTILLHLVLTVSALSFALAEVLVPIVFGPQWAESVPILRALTIGGVFQMAGYVGYWVFLSKGLTRQNLWYAAVSKLVTIIAVVVGAQFGVLAVAACYSTGLAIGWPLLLWWLHRCSDAPARRLLVNGARALGYHSLIAAAGAVTAGALLATSQILAIFGAIAAMAAVVGLLWLAIPAFRADLREIAASRSLLAGRVNRVA